MEVMRDARHRMRLRAGTDTEKGKAGAGLAPAQNSTVARSSTWRASPIEMK